MERLAEDDLKLATVSRAEHVHRYLCARALARGRVLDLACGIGYGSTLLAQAGTVDACVGVDVNEEAVAIARRTADPRCGFLKGGAYALPFGTASFDTIVSLETIEHLQQPADAMAEFRRVLKPNGLLIGSVPTAAFEDFCVREYGPNAYHFQKFSLAGLESLLRPHFPHFDIAVARVDAVAALFPRDGAGPPLGATTDNSIPQSSLDLGSYFFVASAQALSGDELRRAGVTSHGVSYYEAEKRGRDIVLSQAFLQDAFRRAIESKDRLVLDLDAHRRALEARLDECEGLMAAKDRVIAERDERIQALAQDLEAARARASRPLSARIARAVTATWTRRR